MTSYDDICWMTATEMCRNIRSLELSATDVVKAHIERIEAANPKVNAMITTDFDRALVQARKADELASRGEFIGPLHGIPVAHKDLQPTAGLRTTLGSRIFADNVPQSDSLLVKRQKDAGAITLGKTNTPEFGAGSQTFNELFGVTRNPYNTALTCGGSSGGSAVAVSAGMVPLADGSDMFGSIRCPSNFCNIVGLRPSIGRVPVLPRVDGWNTMTVVGPMARTVEDVALYMSVIAGPDVRDPLSLDGSMDFTAPLQRDFKGVRVAWAPTLGGIPVDERVASVLSSKLGVFEDIGCVVDEACPDFSEANRVALVLRYYGADMRFRALNEKHPGVIKKTLVDDILAGATLKASDMGEAETMRTRLFGRVSEFMDKYEFLICPVNQVPPFPVEQEYVSEINGVEMTHYVDWVRSLFYITVTGHPAISVPCGFTDDGLPVGVQIVGRYHAEMDLLRMAYAFEQATRTGLRHPNI